MTTAKAVILGAVLLAAAHLYVSRWELSSSATLTFRLDRWTGTVSMCNEKNDAIMAALNSGEPLTMKCGAN
ncbi:MAG: hypothetical protein AB7M05_05250 [Alphaproteobacteria bacterium]